MTRFLTVAFFALALSGCAAAIPAATAISIASGLVTIAKEGLGIELAHIQAGQVGACK